MKKNTLLFLVVFFAGGLAHAQVPRDCQTPMAVPEATRVCELAPKLSFRADNGNFLCMCLGCQQGTVDYTAMLHCNQNGDSFTQFESIKLPNGNYAFRAANGRYLSVCRDCIRGAAYPDMAAFRSEDALAPDSQFELTLLSNGRYLMRSALNGSFLARCNACSSSSSYPDQVAVHAHGKDEPWAQWEIIPIP